MKTIRRLALITLLLIALFTAMITAVFCIPTSAVRENVEKSAMQIEKDGLWYKPLGFFLFQIDNMTDCQMLLMNATADSDRPMWAAMMAEEYISITDSLHPYNALTSSTKTMAKEGRKPGYVYSDYARYWHGYQIFLRPLLTVFSYHTILAINYTLLALLILFVLYATYKTLGIIHASTLAASLILTNVFIVPLALQFSTCYYIFLLAMVFFMLKPDYAIRKDTCIYTFFIIGGVTSFMDFLTTPLLTLAMPLLTLMALNQGRDPYRKPSILHTSMAWGAGYAIIWISKWCVGTLLTGHDIFSSALGNAQLRVGNTLIFGGRVISINDFIQIIYSRISSIISPWAIIGFILVMAALAALYIYKHRRITRQYGWLLILAMMPVAWFVVMKNHSLQHIFFTWRDFLITVWCLILYIFLTLRKPKVL